MRLHQGLSGGRPAPAPRRWGVSVGGSGICERMLSAFAPPPAICGLGAGTPAAVSCASSTTRAALSCRWKGRSKRGNVMREARKHPRGIAPPLRRLPWPGNAPRRPGRAEWGGRRGQRRSWVSPVQPAARGRQGLQARFGIVKARWCVACCPGAHYEPGWPRVWSAYSCYASTDSSPGPSPSRRGKIGQRPSVMIQWTLSVEMAPNNWTERL